MYGKHLSEDTKKKISESRKGMLASEETKRKLSVALSGENNPFYGKCHSEESRQKMRESQKGLRIGENHFTARKVVQYDLFGNLLNVWSCMSEAGRELGINYHNIYSCCKGNRRTAGGFIWKYFEDKLTAEYLAWCNEISPDKYFKKTVAQYSLSNELICVYESMAEAQAKTGVNYGTISLCCKGKRKTAGGYIWKYYKDNEKIA